MWESANVIFLVLTGGQYFSWVIIILPFGLHCNSTNTNTVTDRQTDKNLTNIANMKNRQTDGNCTNITWSVSNEVRHSYKWLSIKTNFVQDPIKTSNKSNRKNERHPKKAIERMKTVSLRGGGGSEKLLNFHYLQMMKNMEGGGLRVTFYHFIEPKYHKFRRKNCQYMIINIEYLIYQAQFH